MDYLLMAIIGWCGTGWPIRWGGGGGGTPEPGDWPVGCAICRQIIGAVSAIILVQVLMPVIPDTGLMGLVTVSFFGGSFGASLIGGLGGMMKGK